MMPFVLGLISAFVLAALNPFGGPFIAIPLAMFKLELSAWVAVACTIPLAYAQVLFVNLLWDRLLAWPWWMRALERRKTPKLQALLERKDAVYAVAVMSPWIGPWLIMALARFGGHSFARFWFPLLFGLTYVCVLTGLLCVYAPGWLPK